MGNYNTGRFRFSLNSYKGGTAGNYNTGRFRFSLNSYKGGTAGKTLVFNLSGIGFDIHSDLEIGTLVVACRRPLIFFSNSHHDINYTMFLKKVYKPK